MDKYPNLANTKGFPLLEGSAAVADGNLIITFQPHAAYAQSWTGGFWVKVTGNVSTGTQPVFFATAGVANSNVPLMLFSGQQATAASLATGGNAVMLCFWDASTSVLQLISN